MRRAKNKPFSVAHLILQCPDLGKQYRDKYDLTAGCIRPDGGLHSRTNALNVHVDGKVILQSLI